MKILIVDDEAVVRIGIKSSINWQEEGFEVIGEAGNGQKALDLIVEKKPDILITDIKMPVMDGIELIQRVNLLCDKPGVIVLSSYDEFKLVKEAMRLGAFDYLLKLEMVPSDLLSVLNKLRDRLLEQRRIDRNPKVPAGPVQRNLFGERRNLIKNAVKRSCFSRKDLERSAEFLEMDLRLDRIYCLKFGQSGGNDETDALLTQAIINLAEEIVNDDFFGFCFEDQSGTFCVVISAKDKNNNLFTESEIMAVATRLTEMLGSYFNVVVAIGIGRGADGADSLKDAYQKAIQAFDHALFYGVNRVCHWELEARDVEPNLKISPIYFKDKLTGALLHQSRSELEGLFLDLGNQLLAVRGYLAKPAVQKIMFELAYILSEYFETYAEKADAELAAFRNIFEADILKIATFEAVLDWIGNVRTGLIEYLNREGKNENSKAVTIVRKYIDEHYSQDLNLKDLAVLVNLSPFYFSTLFKTNTGINLNEYINNVRIEKSKSLLRNSTEKVYSVSEKVGYQNPNYFNRIFKKKTGLTPLEYKNKSNDS